MDPFDLVGDVLDGQFRVEEFVGEGALSVVYRGVSESVDAPVAIKCLNLPPTIDTALVAPVVEHFLEGCKLHYRLARGHLAIAQTFASGTTVAPRTGTQIPYIVREWFEGESLARDLRRRRAEGEGGRTLAETIAMFEPIAEALIYAHEQDTPHLSLMPSNLFLAKKGDEVSLKLLDFGVGSVVDDVASSPIPTRPPPRLRLLLPTYAAPEQLLASLGPTGPWTDVYALALVLLEVLADRPVMSEKDPSALLSRALNKTERPTPKGHGVDLPPAVDAILTRALLLHPESRQANVAALWADLVAAAKPPRSERRRLGAFLRKVRRARRVSARRAQSIAPPRPPQPTPVVDTPRPAETARPPEPTPVGELPRPPMPSANFGVDEPPTAKARGVVAMLTARAHRASTRPPPGASAPPKKAMPLPPRIPRAPTLVGIAPPPLAPAATAKAEPPPAPAPEPAPAPAPAPPPPPLAIVPPPPELAALVTDMGPPAANETKPEPKPEVPSVIIAPEPQPEPEPERPIVSLFEPAQESAGRIEPHEIPAPALVPSILGRAKQLDRRTRVAVAASGGVVLLGLFVAIIVLATGGKHQSVATAPSASSDEGRSTWLPPMPTASAPPEPSETASAETQPPPPTHRGRFSKRVALAAIAENTADLSDCRRKHGVWGKGQAGVVFKNDGTVWYVLMSAPFDGPEGRCVTQHIKKTRVEPFEGIIGPIYANFVIPY